jgi:hypothetical protein
MLQTFRTGHDPTCQDLGSCRLRFYLKTERAVPGAHSHRREKFSHEALANDPNAAAGVGFVPSRSSIFVASFPALDANACLAALQVVCDGDGSVAALAEPPRATARSVFSASDHSELAEALSDQVLEARHRSRTIVAALRLPHRGRCLQQRVIGARLKSK